MSCILVLWSPSDANLQLEISKEIDIIYLFAQTIKRCIQFQLNSEKCVDMVSDSASNVTSLSRWIELHDSKLVDIIWFRNQISSVLPH